jgi:hypothetical protein
LKAAAICQSIFARRNGGHTGPRTKSEARARPVHFVSFTLTAERQIDPNHQTCITIQAATAGISSSGRIRIELKKLPSSVRGGTEMPRFRNAAVRNDSHAPDHQ